MNDASASFRPPTPLDIPLSDKPSMGDPEFVDGQVREMLDEVRKLLLEAPEGSIPKAEIQPLIQRWADRFYAGNSDYQQTMTEEGQFVWLQNHGLATDERFEDAPKAAITCLVAATVARFASAVSEFVDQQIDEDQCQFRIDTAVEDCATMLLGVENPAD